MRRADLFGKTLMLEKTEDRRRRERQKMRWLDDVTDSMDISLREVWELVKEGKPGVLQFMGSQRVGHNLATERRQQKGRKSKKRRCMYTYG